MTEPVECGACGAPVIEVTLINDSLTKIWVNAATKAWPEGKIRISHHQPTPEVVLGERVKGASQAFAAKLHPPHDKSCNKRGGRR